MHLNLIFHFINTHSSGQIEAWHVSNHSKVNDCLSQMAEDTGDCCNAESARVKGQHTEHWYGNGESLLTSTDGHSIANWEPCIGDEGN